MVRDPVLWVSAVAGVADAAERRGWGAVGVTPSPLPGPSGNVEFFLWLRRGPATLTAEDRDTVVRAGTGPSAPGEKVGP